MFLGLSFEQQITCNYVKCIIDYFAYVIWYINDNFTQSLLLSFGTSNKVGLPVYLLVNTPQIKFIVRLTYLGHFKRSPFYLNLIRHFSNCLVIHFGALCFKFVSMISISERTDVYFINH